MTADAQAAPEQPTVPAEVHLQQLIAALSAAVTAHATQAGHLAVASIHIYGRSGVTSTCDCRSPEHVRPPELVEIGRLARAWEAAHLAETGHGVWRHIRGLDDLSVLCVHPKCATRPPSWPTDRPKS